jgi:putative transposase
MNSYTPRYHGYRFPPAIISHAVWLYHRFSLSFRDVEDLLAQRGIVVSYETIRQWCGKFGPGYAARVKRRQGRLGDTWHLDEVFITIRGRRHYLWRAAKRFFRKLLKRQGSEPRQLVTDKLGSYRTAHRTVMPSVVHDTGQYANNRAEVSHQPARQRERQMRRFKSPAQAQRFLSVHGVVGNLFRVGRHPLRAVHYRMFRSQAFGAWQQVSCA